MNVSGLPVHIDTSLKHMNPTSSVVNNGDLYYSFSWRSVTVPYLEAKNSFTSDELCKFHWESGDLNFRFTNVIRLGKFYLKSLEKAPLYSTLYVYIIQYRKPLSLDLQGLGLNSDYCYLLTYWGISPPTNGLLLFNSRLFWEWNVIAYVQNLVQAWQITDT